MLSHFLVVARAVGERRDVLWSSVPGGEMRDLPGGSYGPEDDEDSGERRIGCAASIFLFLAVNIVLWAIIFTVMM